MKKNKWILLVCLMAAAFITACDDESPIDSEQYFKQVYLVGALDIVKSFDIPYGNEAQNAYVSIASGGSLNIDTDVEVELAHSDEMIDWYNGKYMIDAPVKYQKLDERFYNIPSYRATIKAGDVYTRLPFTVDTKELSCDSLYALTFKIKSTSDYQINENDTVLILNLNLVNEYSGTYQMTAVKFVLDAEGNETAPTSINVQRNLKAVDAHSVRFINEAVAEPGANTPREEYFRTIDGHGVVFTNEGGGNFSVIGWKEMQIVGGTVKKDDKGFTFSYDYVDGSTTYRLRGTLTK